MNMKKTNKETKSLRQLMIDGILHLDSRFISPKHKYKKGGYSHRIDEANIKFAKELEEMSDEVLLDVYKGMAYGLGYDEGEAYAYKNS